MARDGLRMNVRNFLVGLNVSEVRRELDCSVRRGETIRAGYIEEFLHELEDELADCGAYDGCDSDPMWDGEDDVVTPARYF
jgi:hypothetical protein